MANDRTRQILNKKEILVELENTENKLDAFSDKHFICCEGNKTLIYTETEDENGDFMLKYLPEKDFLRMYNDCDVYKPNKNNKLGWHGIASFWIESHAKRSYESIIFKPNYSDDRFYNLWSGFYIKDSAKSDFPCIEHHLKNVWCNGDDEYYEYVLKWFAHMIQYPDERPGVALVIKGEKGTGKSTFLEVLAKSMLGHMYLHVASAHHLTGNFNGHLFSKLLVAADEAVWAGDKKAEGKLKSMITDETIMIERKGIDAISKDNYIRVIFLTNESYSVPATYDERRYFALKISNKYKNDKEYFGKLYTAMKDKEVVHFFNYLKEYNFDKRDVLTPPASKALFEDIKSGMDVFDRWLYDLIDNLSSDEHDNDELDWLAPSLNIGFSKKVKTSDLHKSYTLYIQYLKSNNVYFKGEAISPVMLTQKLTNGKEGSYTFNKSRSSTARCIDMPSINEAKEIFGKKFSCQVPWSQNHVEVNDFFESSNNLNIKLKNEESMLPDESFIKLVKDIEAEESLK